MRILLSEEGFDDIEDLGLFASREFSEFIESLAESAAWRFGSSRLWCAKKFFNRHAKGFCHWEKDFWLWQLRSALPETDVGRLLLKLPSEFAD